MWSKKPSKKWDKESRTRNQEKEVWKYGSVQVYKHKNRPSPSNKSEPQLWDTEGRKGQEKLWRRWNLWLPLAFLTSASSTVKVRTLLQVQTLAFWPGMLFWAERPYFNDMYRIPHKHKGNTCFINPHGHSER